MNEPVIRLILMVASGLILSSILWVGAELNGARIDLAKLHLEIKHLGSTNDERYRRLGMQVLKNAEAIQNLRLSIIKK